MPATRRSTGSARPTGKQATLSFNHRVTKSVPKSGKSVTSSTPKQQSPLKKELPIEPEDASPTADGDEDDDDENDENDVAIKDAPVAPEPAKSAAEQKAQKVSDKQIEAYWRALERERIAKRVHQEDLSLAEKVLRYWDVSSQYGPCVGISRAKRWQRADRLGLNPPVEVMAVLMKESEKKEESEVGVNAHMDDILNSTAVGAG
ncbi:DNA polymerase delta, subunit 4-domain-containing protein [Xylariaceae sp. FL0016]|nr:DNA polymerase delta, subunit 4-domain-containing protein [Xylariaceae sp. FL0016]